MLQDLDTGNEVEGTAKGFCDGAGRHKRSHVEARLGDGKARDVAAPGLHSAVPESLYEETMGAARVEDALGAQ